MSWTTSAECSRQAAVPRQWGGEDADAQEGVFESPRESGGEDRDAQEGVFDSPRESGRAKIPTLKKQYSMCCAPSAAHFRWPSVALMARIDDDVLLVASGGAGCFLLGEGGELGPRSNTMAVKRLEWSGCPLFPPGSWCSPALGWATRWTRPISGKRFTAAFRLNTPPRGWPRWAMPEVVARAAHWSPASRAADQARGAPVL